MLNRLSKYQQEIAIYLIALLITSAIIPLKADAKNNHSFNSNFYSSNNSNYKIKTAKPVASAPYAAPINKLETPKLINTSLQDNPAKKKINNAKLNTIKNFNYEPFIGGPGQPEMGAFKPVGADNMVDLFSGDMSYNIPLLDVGGYPVNIFYNSGITMDQEASWAGLGWNINPGTIMRNLRGVPDDFNGTDTVTKTLSMNADRTWGVGISGSGEIVGLPFLSAGGNFGLNFNNQRGVSTEFGLNANVSMSKALGDEKTANMSLGASVGAGINLSSQGGATFTPSISVSLKEKDNKVGTSTGGTLGASVGYNSRAGLQSLHIDAEVSKTKTTMNWPNVIRFLYTGKSGSFTDKNSASLSVLSSNISFAYPSVTPSIKARMSRLNISASIKSGAEYFFIYPNTTFNGFYSQQRIAEEDKVTKNPAYGVMFYQNGNEDPNALLDFNRLQDGVFTKTNPAIAIPAYSYDVFSMSGEGVGGSFRAYRGDLGFVHDQSVTTREDAGKVGFDIGGGPGSGKGGINLEYVFSPTTAGSWEQGNFAKNMLSFKKSKAAYQSVYFKNPGEKTIPDIKFQNAVGAENLVRLKMAGYGTPNTTLLPILEQYDKSKYNLKNDISLDSRKVIKESRDKRTQIISCLNAEEASRVGFDTTINSYDPSTPGVIFGNCNSNVTKINRNSQAPHYSGPDTYRKAHHISEIDVLGGDGRKYVYGIPVYNTKQVDATFAISNGSTNTFQSTYNSGTDDGLGNTQHKDWYIEKEEMPAYTHSFLLTELVSPNYVDLTGDGISEDDMGDAVKFNYSQLAPIKWRTPTLATPNIATYSEGLKTYSQDDKGHYTYGEREQWYLYTVESKNMVAKFYVENDRKDGKQVKDINGGLDPNYGAQRLSKISLFSKGDLVRLGANAKPIKTVHLQYDYSLCPNTPTNSGEAENVTVNNTTVNLNANKGKLTLRSIYFTYNGNERTKKNKYTFHYPTDKNPSYSYTSNDRWGNYKPAIADPTDGGLSNNLGGLSNADFPFSVQDKTKADKYAGAWVMDSIGLPSGGKIKINYESDDYAYVQDTRAASMYQIEGFGATASPTAQQFTNNTLYSVAGTGPLIVTSEYDYIYATIPTPISVTQSGTSQLNELQSKYFSSYPDVSKQIMVKLTIPMSPKEVSIDAGYLIGNEMVAMYVDVESIGLIAPPSGQTTSNKIFVKVKRLETHTPMVQYALQFTKNSLPGIAFPGSVNDAGVVGTVKALGGMFGSFKELISGVDKVLMSKGICRTVETSKSFLRLSNPYFNKLGGGLRVKKVTISDNWDKMTKQAKSTYGQEYRYTKKELINNKLETISSGVASWEPAIGGEENPHREMIAYYNHNKGGPFDYNSVELPLAEMFFPSANVGYSHVEVLPLHRDTVKNAVGTATTDFFTTKDFPTKSDNTFLENIVDGGASFYESPKILQILHVNSTKSYALSQGFKVDLNDMNGKVKRQESIGANGALISSTDNYYNIITATDKTYKFNHLFPTINNPSGEIKQSLLGRDIEVMTDLRNHNSQTISANININIDVQVFGAFPVILPPIFSPVYFEESDYKSASMLKVINHFGMLDSTVVIDKGSQVSTKNLLYDAETGNVLLTRTNNEYDKPIYNFSYPAHWAYSGMEPAYQNIDVIYDNLTFRNGIIENPVQAGQTIDFKNFESGDELYVYSPLKNGPLLTSCDQGLCALPKNKANRIWAINTNKTGGPDKFTFMDAEGNPYSAMQVSMRIIRSGHRNMLEQMVGSITSLQSPIVNNQLLFNDATGIIQTSAATFKDHWRVDDANFLKEITGTSCNPFVPANTNPVSNFAASTANLAPPNDEPCGAILLPVTSTCNYLSTSNIDATFTQSPVVSGCYGTSIKNADVWFKVVVPSTGYITIKTNNGSASFQPGSLTVYSSNNANCSTLTFLNCAFNVSYINNMPNLTLNYTPNQTLFIRVSGFDNKEGTFDICATTLLPPTNDECSGAIMLTENLGEECISTTEGTTFAATQSINPTSSCIGTSNDDDVWFQFFATRTTEKITLRGISNFNILNNMTVAVYDGACGSLSEILCFQDGIALLSGLTTQHTYYLRVMLTSALPNGAALDNYSFNICISKPSVGAGNGSCSSSTLLNVNQNNCNTSGYTIGTTFGATPSPLNEAPIPSCLNVNGDDVWFRFVAIDPRQTIYIRGLSGQQFYGAVYTGSCGAFTEIRCTSSDYNGGIKMLFTNLSVNSIYYIRVLSIGLIRQINFSIRIDSPPSNETWDNATTISVNPNSTCTTTMAANTFGASASNIVLPSCFADNGLSDDVWYSFVANSTTHTITADYNNNPSLSGLIGTAMAVYEGPGIPSATTLKKCTNNVFNGNNRMVLTNLIPLSIYYIRVSAFNPNFGCCLNICITTPISACTNAEPFCIGTTTGAASVVNVPSLGGSNGNTNNTIYGCLENTPNPKWYYLKIANSGNIKIKIKQTTNGGSNPSLPIDVDFALWGPFNSVTDGCNQLVDPFGPIRPISCSYSQNAIETAEITNAVSGKYYLMLVTNYDNQPGNIEFLPADFPPVAPLGSTDCCITNTATTTYACVSRFSNTFINPYVEGVFGNWRADSTYTYYGGRKETDPSVAVDIRTGGTIKDYKDFWNFNSLSSYFLKRNYAANKEWAWNSTSTQFNSKGYETENKDPLGRFNAGVYGYNKQLPIAVANNARLREVMFDGFEDYDYKTQNSCNQSATLCSAAPRHATFTDVTSANLSNQEHHTGRYSLKVAAGAAVALGAAVKNASLADAGYGFNISISDKSCPDTSFNLSGNGFISSNPAYSSNILLNTSGNKSLRNDWAGYLLPSSTGIHEFFTTGTDDNFSLKIYDGINEIPQNLILNFEDYYGFNGGVGYTSVYLVKGKKYRIKASIDNADGPGGYGGGGMHADLKWKTPNMKCLGMIPSFIPAEHIYSNSNFITYSSVPSLVDDVVITPRTITSLTQSQATGNRFNDVFSPLQNTKMVLSAWVKESTDCKCSTYVNNAIDLNIDGTITTLKPTGNIIEGWQRYEAYFDISNNAQVMSIALKNTSTSGDVFFDDVRIHPFNANEKSFVYHSSNLRLMAELDENNYASFYEYDDDGTLTRVKKETQRGIKTITETRSALYKQVQ